MFKCEPDQHYNISSVITPGTVPPSTALNDFVQITDSKTDDRELVNYDPTKVENYYFITQNSELYVDGQMLRILDLPNISLIQDKIPGDIKAEVKILIPNLFGESDLLELELEPRIIKNRRFAENSVYFFDRGKYKITSFHSLDIFSSTNVSYIGLYQNSGIPETVIMPFTDQEFAYSIQLASENIHFNNILFDAGSMEMYNDKCSHKIGQSLLTIGTADTRKAPDSANHFSMKNCRIANVGNHSGSLIFGQRKNVALAIYSSHGFLSFEQLKIVNCKTKAECGIIEANSSSRLFFQDLMIDMSDVYVGSLGLSYAIKFYHRETAAVDPENTLSDSCRIIFAAGLEIKSKIPRMRSILIESYDDNCFCFPENFHFALFKNKINKQTLPAAYILDSPVRPEMNYSLYDLKENSFLISPSFSTDLSLQFQQVEQTIKAIKEGRRIPAPTDITIKLEAPNCSINGFKIPPFCVGQTFPKLHIVAIPDLNQAIDREILLPVTKNAQINLPVENKVYLYYFDFHTLAHYTMQEAVYGIAALPLPLKDPYDDTQIPNYPNYADYSLVKENTVKNSHRSNFRACCFTALLHKIEIEDNIDLLNLTIGQTVTLSAIPTIENNSFTMKDINFDIENTADDETIHWFLERECDILTLTYTNNTASITAVKPGITILIAKAIDRYNKGEIEKPYATVTVVIRE